MPGWNLDIDVTDTAASDERLFLTLQAAPSAMVSLAHRFTVAIIVIIIMMVHVVYAIRIAPIIGNHLIHLIMNGAE
jgi:hypothetical protein